MIVIVGASSSLGRVTARLLLAEGKPVRAVTRTPSALDDLHKLGAEVVHGDLRNPESLVEACEGATQVFATTHAFNGKGDNTPRTVDDVGNRSLIDVAKAEGIQHLVFTSALGARSDHPVDFFRIKYKVEEYLKVSGLGYTILRPSAFMEFWAGLVGVPIIERGQTTIFGRGENPINFVSVEDVARYAVLALESPGAHQRIIEIGGPQNLSLLQVAATFEHLAGRKAKKKHVPLWVMRAMSVLLQPINPGLCRQIRAGVYMDTARQDFDVTETAREFGVNPTPLEDVVRRHFLNAR